MALEEFICVECISEKAVTSHSSTLAWKIPWMEEPGRLLSMGSLRVGHNWVTSLSLFTFVDWRRKWQPTPVFLPGESQGWGSLVGCLPGASVRNSAHGKGHEEGGFGICKAGLSLRKPPFPSIYPPKPESTYFTVSCSHHTSDFTGGWPPLPLLEKELTYSSKSIKIPGCDKSVSTYELLWRLSSLPVQVHLVTCDCLQPPNHERQEMF